MTTEVDLPTTGQTDGEIDRSTILTYWGCENPHKQHRICLPRWYKRGKKLVLCNMFTRQAFSYHVIWKKYFPCFRYLKNGEKKLLDFAYLWSILHFLLVILSNSTLLCSSPHPTAFLHPFCANVDAAEFWVQTSAYPLTTCYHQSTLHISNLSCYVSISYQ